MSALVRAVRALVRRGVLVGGERVEVLTIESLGTQDDDLRVDVGGRVVSDTRLNVSAYNGFVVAAGGVQDFNNAWSTTGFRCLRILRPGRKGEPVRVWTTDVGGSCQLSPYRVTIEYAAGTRRSFTAGRTAAVVPPAWPAGTVSLVAGEMAKTDAQRPWQPPGSPPIWVPNGDFTL